MDLVNSVSWVEGVAVVYACSYRLSHVLVQVKAESLCYGYSHQSTALILSVAIRF